MSMRAETTLPELSYKRRSEIQLFSQSQRGTMYMMSCGLYCHLYGNVNTYHCVNTLLSLTGLQATTLV